MEHSYTRTWKPTTNSEVIATRTILVDRPPLCPSCHQLPPNHDEKVDTPEAYNIPIPTYNEEAARRALNNTEEMIKSCHNRNSDGDDWTQRIHTHNLTDQQLDLFKRVERILDMDQLGRLAIAGLPNECLRRNAIIEKSVSRMRAALASVHWEPRLTSWIHDLLMTHLPSKYMVSYIDILQTIKRKLPTLVDKMLYHKPIEMHKDYMNAIMKKAWEPSMTAKTRTLPNNPVIVVITSNVCSAYSSSREKRWIDLLSTLGTVESTMINMQVIDSHKQLDQVTEHLVAVTRAKIQEIRNQTPNRHVILAGFNAGAAIAVQVALSEPVNAIVCLGFAFNTLNGVRGVPDDRILDLITPVLFVIGQNAQRSSQEEIESLREKMCAQTSLVVVGSSDDALRVKRLNRSTEGVSQSMIDNMIMDEIQEFATSCILNPPGPRKLKNGCRKVSKQRAHGTENGPPTKRMRLNGKQKSKKVGRIRVDSPAQMPNLQNGITKQTNEMDDAALQLAFESVLPHDVLENGTKPMENPTESSPIKSNALNSTSHVSPNIRQKVKYIPANQFVHIKPPPINTQKIYVKQQNGNQSYTLGVKNINTTDIPVMHNKLITVKNKMQPDQVVVENELAESKSNGECSAQTDCETDLSLQNIDIFDIPILLADNDGNILENQNGEHADGSLSSDAPPQRSLNSIDIISEEIITDTIIHEDPVPIEQNDSQSSDDEMVKQPQLTAPALKRSGNFIVLNKSAFSQLKTVKRIPAAKIKKFMVRRNSFYRPTYIDSTGPGTTIVPKNYRITRINVPKLPNTIRQTDNHQLIGQLQNGRHDSGPLQNGQSQLTKRPESPKSGILIKRNHLKNIIIRKGNVVQSAKSSDKEAAERNGIDVSPIEPTNDSKDDSLKNLIADLET